MTGPLNWEEREARISDALKEAFPATPHVSLSRQSRKIGDAYSLAFSLQSIERLDRHPRKDRESLHSAAKALLRAAAHLSDVGWHGGKVLEALICERQKNDPYSQRFFSVFPNILSSREFLVEELTSLAAILREQGSGISDDAPSVNTAFGEGPAFEKRATKPTATAAKFTAQECAKAFYELSGQRPTIPKSDGVAYGKFLEFVGSVFKALEMTESAETWARDACDWFRAIGPENIQKT